MDASDSHLSKALQVPEDHVRNTWLTSRTPIVDPRPATMRRKYRDTVVPRFARPTPLSLAKLQEYADLASNLRKALNAILEEEHNLENKRTNTPSDRACYYAPVPQHFRLLDQATKASTSSCASSLAPADDSPASSSDVASLDPCALPCSCGFSERSKRLTAVGNAIVRGPGGLYAGARHARGLERGQSVYAELQVIYAGGSGGVAFGVMPQSHPIDKLVGGEAGSLALHSAAQIVEGGSWRHSPDGRLWGTGDVIGMFVSVSLSGEVHVRYTINGTHAGVSVSDAKLQKAVQQGERVHIGVSLLRPGARVALRCCSRSWYYSPFSDDALASSLCNPRSAVLSAHLVLDGTSAVLTP